MQSLTEFIYIICLAGSFVTVSSKTTKSKKVVTLDLSKDDLDKRWQSNKDHWLVIYLVVSVVLIRAHIHVIYTLQLGLSSQKSEMLDDKC